MPWIKSCLCHQEKKKPPVISPPIHLLLKPEGHNSPGPSHAFRCKVFKKPRPCHLCHQPIFNQGSCCRVCKYVCHKVCESKEAADRFTDTSWQIHKQWLKTNLAQKHVSPQFQFQHPHNNERPFTKTDSIDTNNISNNNNNSISSNKNCDIRKADGAATNGNAGVRKRVEIQTVQTTVERTTNAALNFVNGDVIVHTHEEPIRNGNPSTNNKMVSSSSYNGIYGEALTTQPRKSSCSVTGGMDLSYVTERIIALWFPASCTAQAFRQGQRQASHMLINKHGDNYMVFNLSEPKRTLKTEHKHVEEVGWSARLAPPLERICSVCKQIDSWLSSDQHRIAVLHAKGSKDKLGVIVAAYMHYSNICGTADQALDRFSMRKYLEDNIGPLYLPSNKRYIEYFAGLLSHNIKVNSAPLYLTHVTVVGAPSIQNGGCRAFLKLYEGHTPIYTSGVYTVSSGVSQFTVNLAGERRRGLQLRGDILIKCYHRGELERETIFSCQFHTCAVSDYTLSFTRQELDHACYDTRFPSDGAVELHFSPGLESRHPGPAPTPAIPVTATSEDPVIRSDSPFDFEESEEEEDSDSDDVNHTFGPLDGSIYATIAKKPELSPGAVSSPLTVSMDSGISSAGHQQNANTNASASPPLTGQPSPLSPEDQHRELDELLSDMMLTVQNIPDLKPQRDLDNVRYIDDEEDKNIPYHARHDSRPFSYGVNSSSMIGDAKKLSSPSLVRKASFNRNQGAPNKGYQSGAQYERNNNNKFTYGTYNGKNKDDSIDAIFTQSALSAGSKKEYYRDSPRKIEPLKRSNTDTVLRHPDKTYNKSGGAHFSDSGNLSPPGGYKAAKEYETYNNNLTWLQKQQLKLKERKEMQRREERQPYEHSLMTELRSVQNRHMKPTASHRLDGYTSDTTAFADDDDDFTIPLHINTKNGAAMSPASTASYSTTKSSYSSSRTERPFMQVKREYAKNAAPQSPQSALAASPLGHVVRSPARGGEAHGDSGLLSLVEQDSKRFNTTNPVGIDTNAFLPPESTPRIDALTDLIANLSNGSDKSNNSSSNSSAWQYRDEVDSSSPHSASSRPQTPAFPVARTPYANASTPTVQFDIPGERLPPKSPTTIRKDRPISPSDFIDDKDIFHSTARNFSESYSPKSPNFNGSSSPTVYQSTSRRSSVTSNESPQEVSPVHVKFVSDSSRYWYKPTITRDEAINMLRDKPPGTFVVRNSNTFTGGFGMALKVSSVPMNVQNKDELVRHFLIEPTSRGVRIKGCPNEPVFSSLSALVYQHSITQIALPCRLILPERDIAPVESALNQTQMLLIDGAACNVFYLLTIDLESLTGPQAIRKAVAELFKQPKLPEAKVVHFKVSKQGITLTDNKRELFFRKHYPINTISHCGLDPDDNRWNARSDENTQHPSRKIYGFVARKQASGADNQCHLFADMDPSQPASAIVSFVNKVLSSISLGDIV